MDQDPIVPESVQLLNTTCFSLCGLISPSYLHGKQHLYSQEEKCSLDKNFFPSKEQKNKVPEYISHWTEKKKNLLKSMYLNVAKLSKVKVFMKKYQYKYLYILFVWLDKGMNV